jgi:hypothetical protein
MKIMIKSKQGIRAEDVRTQGKYRLFVEGNTNDSLDPNVLNTLLGEIISVETLGSSYNIRNVAITMHQIHPNYYFLIDRDHFDDFFVDKCWNNFPDPNNYNLLVWRRREIENYFLDPEYIINSSYCKVTIKDLENKIIQCANERLFFDAANLTIISILKDLNITSYINLFEKVSQFLTKNDALSMLKKLLTSNIYRCKVNDLLDIVKVDNIFEHYLKILTEDKEKIISMNGEWLKLMKGKPILSKIINSECFQIKNTDNELITGPSKLNIFAKDLLKKDFSIQPQDFIDLKNLIQKKLHL